jgi:hypothetical protein
MEKFKIAKEALGKRGLLTEGYVSAFVLCNFLRLPFPVAQLSAYSGKLNLSILK